MKGDDALERQKLWLFVGVAVLFAIAFALTLNRNPSIRQKSDYFVSWYAIRDFWRDGRNLYDPLVNHEVDMIVYGRDYEYCTGFYYPPHLAHFRQNLPGQYQKIVWGLLLLYAVGWVGFLAGFASGEHITWSGLPIPRCSPW